LKTFVTYNKSFGLESSTALKNRFFGDERNAPEKEDLYQAYDNEGFKLNQKRL
jgi:hypothetical protein